jgi:hypothetical protein
MSGQFHNAHLIHSNYTTTSVQLFIQLHAYQQPEGQLQNTHKVYKPNMNTATSIIPTITIRMVQSRITDCKSNVILVCNQNQNKLRGFSSASEQYRLRDRRYSENYSAKLTGTGVSRSQRIGSARTLISVSRQEPLLSHSSSSSVILTSAERTPF